METRIAHAHVIAFCPLRSERACDRKVGKGPQGSQGHLEDQECSWQVFPTHFSLDMDSRLFWLESSFTGGMDYFPEKYLDEVVWTLNALGMPLEAWINDL